MSDDSGSTDHGRPEAAMAADVRVPERPDSIPATRAFLSRLLDGWEVDGEVIDDASLLASELMSNAVNHGRGLVHLQVELDAGVLHVGVRDDADGRPVVEHPGAASPRGRGMWIIESIARDWGTDEGDDGGKTVWFELSVLPARPEGSAASG